MIDGKVFGIQRARAAAAHAAQTSHLSTEIAALKAENEAMRDLLSQAVAGERSGAIPVR